MTEKGTESDDLDLTSFDEEILLGHLGVEDGLGVGIEEHVLQNVLGGDCLVGRGEECEAHGLFSLEIQLRGFEPRQPPQQIQQFSLLHIFRKPRYEYGSNLKHTHAHAHINNHSTSFKQ